MENRVQEDYVEIDLREYLRVLADKWKLVVGILLIAIISSGIYSYLIAQPVYQATAQIKLGTDSGNYSETNFVVEVLQSSSYWRQINQELNLKAKQGNLKQMVESKLEVESEEDIINLTFKATDAQKAKLALQQVIELVKTDSDQQFKKRLKQRKAELTEVKSELASIKSELKTRQNDFQAMADSSLSTVDKLILNNDFANRLSQLKELKTSLVQEKNNLLREIDNMIAVKVINPPLENNNPIKPNKRLNIAIAGILALMIGVFLAFVSEWWAEGTDN
ncbi:MAG: YveK family protein [Bacillota bacterium]